MRYRTHGTRLAALLLVAIMALSVFAIPAVADVGEGDSEAAEIEYDADKVAGGFTESGTFTLGLDDGDGDGENVTVELDDLEDEDDMSFASVSESSESEVDLIATVQDGGNELEIKIAEEADTDDNATVDFTLTAADQAADKAEDYNERAVASVTDDNDFATVNEEEVVQVDINTGEAAELYIDNPADDTTFNEDDQSIEVDVQDAQGNALDADESEEIEVTFELVHEVEGTLDTVTEEDVSFDVDIKNETEDDSLQSRVGAFDIDVSTDAEGIDDVSDDIIIEPEEVDFEFDVDPVEMTAGETIDANINLTDGDNIISDENITVANVTIDESNGHEDAQIDGELIDDEGAELDIEDGENTFGFTATRAADERTFEVDEVLGNEEPSGDNPEDLTVISAEPHDIDVVVNDDTIAFDGSTDVDGMVVDEYGNHISDTDFDGTNIDLQYTLDATNIPDRVSSVQTTDLTGTTQITIGDGEDIDPAVGNFDVEVEVIDIDESAVEGEIAVGDTSSDEINITAEADVAFDDEGTPVEAGQDRNFQIDLDEQDDLENDEDVDEVHVDVTLDSAPDDGGDLDRYTGPELDGESFGEASSEVTVTVTEVETNVDFNAVTASNDPAGELDDYQLSVDDENDVLTDSLTSDSLTSDSLTVDPTTADQLSVESLDNDLLGVVENAGDDDAFVEITDTYDNPIADGLERTDIDVDAELLDEDGNEVESNTGEILGIDGEQSFSVLGIGVDEETPTGDVTLNVSAEDDDVTVNDDSNELSLVHETADLDAGYQVISIPQPISGGLDELETQNVTDITFYNNTDATQEDPNASVGYDEVVDLSASELLHYGHFANGENDDARVGFTFAVPAEDQSVVATESLQEGWNLVGTNLNISDSEQDLAEVKLHDDLEAISEIGDDTSSDNFSKATDLTTVLNISDSGDKVSDLTGDEYGGYWIFLDEDSDFVGDDRAVSGPSYDPAERAGQ